MARRRSFARNAAEYFLGRSLLLATQLLPARLVAPTSRLLGRVLYGVAGGRRRVVRSNIRLAYGDHGDAPDPDAVGRAAFAGLCLSFMELARAPNDRAWLPARLTFKNPENWDRLRSACKDGGVVLAGAHFGAYEIMGLVLSLHDMTPVTSARPLDNPYLQRWLARARSRYGQHMVSNRDSLSELFAALDAGRPVGVLTDLNHRRRRRIWVDYFGTAAATAPTAAVLAIRSGRPVVRVAARRVGPPLHFEIDIGDLHYPRKNAGRRAETQRLMDTVTRELEEAVRADPGAWLWTHNRWKTRPRDDERKGTEDQENQECQGEPRNPGNEKQI
ncbi:MAG: hypothetical protein CMJ83_08840 [Planctomycetes bacterium]|nr:hypothetical protein [Planctomycetota bacterium]